MSTLTPLLERPPAPAPARVQPEWTSAPPVPARSQLRQLIVSLVVLPLTLVPFFAYAMLTPEGRLVRDRALVALFPPTLPMLSPEQRAAAVAAAPHYQGPVMALAYHGIGSASDAEGGFVISPKRFGEHLATLKAAGMQTVTAAQVADAFAKGTPLPPNAVLISFDDGRSDAMMFADPLLDQAGMSATMFVIAGAASRPGVYYASWDKIEGYARSGRWDIQSHTTGAHREHKADGGQSLPALTSRAPGESLDEYRARVRDDLGKASAAIQAHAGQRPVAFAYPFGAYGGDRTNDPAIAAVLREEVARQYSVAFQQDDQETVPLLTADHDRLRLRRVEVENWSGVELLERIERARQSLVGPETAPTASPGAAPVPVVAAGPPPNGASSPSPANPPTGPALQTGGGVPTAVVTTPGSSGGTGGAPAPVTVAPVTVPPTAPPTTAGPPTTSPPTTAPPATSPPTTQPPTTSPPTTVCKPAGNSGKCVPAQT